MPSGHNNALNEPRPAYYHLTDEMLVSFALVHCSILLDRKLFTPHASRNPDMCDDNKDGDSAMPIIMANECGGMAPVQPYSRIPGRILTTFVTPSSPECRIIHVDICCVVPSVSERRRTAYSDLTSCREWTGRTTREISCVDRVRLSLSFSLSACLRPRSIIIFPRRLRNLWCP